MFDQVACQAALAIIEEMIEMLHLHATENHDDPTLFLGSDYRMFVNRLARAVEKAGAPAEDG